MDHYIDILIKPDDEMRLNILFNTIYTKLHKALHDLASTKIGVSFPRCNLILGNILRIHGKSTDLENLMILNWLGGMRGYCEISSIRLVPDGSKYRTISRKQTTMSQSKLRRLIKRNSINEDDIRRYKTKIYARGLSNPFVELVSASNGHKHRRYIEFGELLDQPIEGEYDQFGLSKLATIPWFD